MELQFSKSVFSSDQFVNKTSRNIGFFSIKKWAARGFSKRLTFGIIILYSSFFRYMIYRMTIL